MRRDRVRLRAELEEEVDGRWVVQAQGAMLECTRLLCCRPTREEAVAQVLRHLVLPAEMLLARGRLDRADMAGRIEVVVTPKERGWRPTAARQVALALVLRRAWKGTSFVSRFALTRRRSRLWLDDPTPALLGPVLLRRLGRLTGLRPADLRAREVTGYPDAPDPEALRAHTRLVRALRRARLADPRRAEELVACARTFAGSAVAFVEVNVRERQGALTAGCRLHHIDGRWFLSRIGMNGAWSLPEGTDPLSLVGALFDHASLSTPPPAIVRRFGLRPATHETVFGPL